MLFSASIKGSTWLFGLGLLLLASGSNAQRADMQTPTALQGEQGADGWSSYTVRGRGFSVLLPAVPAMTAYDSDRYSSSTKVKLRNLIAVYSQGTVYSIHIYDRNLSLDEILKRFTIPEEVSRRDIDVGGVLGKEYGPVNSNNRNRFFVSGSYIYQFATRSAVRETPDADVARFFGSIKFERTQTDQEIVEGPGEVPPTYSLGEETTSDEKVFNAREVTTKVIVITKPEPSYTEAARKNEITGTVVLRAVFTSSGAVTNMHAVGGLPNGLTERAIGAARQIKFIPATRDGQFVSQHIQLEYNFNLY